MLAHRCLIACCLAATALACSEPQCPAGYMKYGDLCRRCPPGEERERGQCVPIWDGSVEAIEGDESEEEVDAGLPDDSSAVADDALQPLDDGSVGTSDGSTVDAEQRADDACPLPGSCQTVECTATFCLHGGACSPSAGDPTCDCSGTGYQGTMCDVDIDECASANACSSPDYPCVQTLAPGYTCQGQFADWPIPDAVAGSKTKPDYDIVSTPGVVIDKATGLLWQRVLPATRLNPGTPYAGCTGMSESVGDTCSWMEAKSYCAALSLGGISQWRLPTKIELESISDHTRANPAIDPVFPNTPIDNFWTSSRLRSGSSDVWRVFSGAGSSSGILTPATARVRCVYGVSDPGTPANRYVVNAAEDTVRDSRTGLVWQRSIAPTKHSWSSALAHCQDRGAGWRLPSLKELLTLVDPARSVPAIDASAFPSTPVDAAFWSATPAVEGSFVAWYVGFLNGDASLAADGELAVRCVR